MWKVLLVEDEVFVRESIKEIINWEKWGFTVIGEVGSGVEALEIIKNESPHLVITDIVMPEMDGIELLKRVREAGYRSKFVMLTCMNDLSYAIQAMEYGASSYILKLSMNVEDLRNTLDKVSMELQEQAKEQQAAISLTADDLYLSWEQEKTFIQAFEQRNVERCLQLLDGIWNTFQQDQTPLLQVKAVTKKLATICHRIAKSDLPDVDDIHAAESREALYEQLKTKVEQLITQLAEQAGELTSHPEINKILTYIHQHYEQDITVKMMARYVIMSENYVSALFRQKTGKNLIRYLHEVRIDKAKQYLETTDYPVNEIGHLVGFANDNYFIRIFKRVTKQTPSQYRDRYLKAQ